MARHEFTREQILSTSLEILGEYQRDNLKLTLRQMYYQFVARGLVPSGDVSYKRIGSVLTDARFTGDFPIDGIEDRGREVRPGAYALNDVDIDNAIDNAAELVKRFPYFIRKDRWYGQPTHVSVWVEKQALEGIFEKPCEDAGVSWFPCKGYPSVSALWSWIQGVNEAAADGYVDKAVVLYFGDHDPDGMEIPKSALRSIETLVENYAHSLDNFPRVVFKRVALNMDQIEQYNPPPFEAKVTSSRYENYRSQHGEEAWELDALEPRVLQRLISTSIKDYFISDVQREQQQEVNEVREKFVERLLEPNWFTTTLKESL